MLSDKELQVVRAAYDVFFRYGFARTTMGDLAKAAGMSRPALYLVYASKEEIFKAVVWWLSDQMLETIRSTQKDDWPLERKLVHVLELCIGKVYDQVKAHPDAQDLLALDGQIPALASAYAKVQGYLAELLEGAVQESGLKATAADVARTLASAMRGFKLAAADGKDLRRLIAIQVALTTAALGQKASSIGAPQARAPAKRRLRKVA
jgi:AcrR family transcriptional regulator